MIAVLVDLIGGSDYVHTELVRYGWASGSAVSQGGTPDTVEEAGEAQAGELAAQVIASGEAEEEPDRRGRCAVVSSLGTARHPLHLVVWDVENRAWWWAGVRRAVPTCRTCSDYGQNTPATTNRNGRALCAECATAIDSAPDQVAEDAQG